MFASCYCSGAWKTHSGPAQDWAPLATAVTDYQDPSKADKISAIQKELDDTTAVLVRRPFVCRCLAYSAWSLIAVLVVVMQSKTIENVLERGEKLDDLVSKSQDLSTQSKVFYKQAKKTNSCCVVM